MHCLSRERTAYAAIFQNIAHFVCQLFRLCLQNDFKTVSVGSGDFYSKTPGNLAKNIQKGKNIGNKYVVNNIIHKSKKLIHNLLWKFGKTWWTLGCI